MMKELKYFAYALLLFLPTIHWFGVELYILFIPAFIWEFKNRKINVTKESFVSLSKRRKLAVYLGLLALLLTFLNALFHGKGLLVLAKSHFVFFPLVCIAAYLCMNKKVMRYLLWIIVFEVLIGLTEYVYGANSFITSLELYYSFDSYTSLYHTRIFGLSSNSSYLAQKCFVGLLLLQRYPFTCPNKYRRIFVFVILALGLVFTFGRTTLLIYFAFLFYYVLEYILYLTKKRTIFLPITHEMGIIGMTLTSVGLVFFMFWKNQFSRFGMVAKEVSTSTTGGELIEDMGIEKVDMAGRQEIWAGFADFIQQNPWWGNGSEKLYMFENHAHNAYLEFAATHGLIIFFIAMLAIALSITRRNIVFVAGVLIYSFAQYGIFWSISFLDILFFGMLLFTPKIIRNESKFKFAK